MVTVDFDDSFNTKVWSVDHIIIVIYINGVCYRGFSKCPKFGCSGDTFGGCWLLRVKGKFYALILIGINVMFNNRVCYMGVFRKVANSRAGVTLFDSGWLLWIWMVFHYKSIVSQSYNHCPVHQWSWL